MICRFLPLLLLFFMSFAPNASKNAKRETVKKNDIFDLATRIEIVYKSLDVNNFSTPDSKCFAKAMEGFYALKQRGLIQKDILTLVDFSISSAKKRLWVIDLSTNIILYNTFVAHGMNSGVEYANEFSNSSNSNKSSLGFYATGETYMGKHGLSLKLDGLEMGVNNNARSRAVVIHGADYANPTILKSQNYLGRSQGCPAIPEYIKKDIIKTIKDKSCLFIYHPTRNYQITSHLVSQS
jgi:L,D-transpeptidase catalytic domain